MVDETPSLTDLEHMDTHGTPGPFAHSASIPKLRSMAECQTPLHYRPGVSWADIQINEPWIPDYHWSYVRLGMKRLGLAITMGRTREVETYNSQDNNLIDLDNVPVVTLGRE